MAGRWSVLVLLLVLCAAGGAAQASGKSPTARASVIGGSPASLAAAGFTVAVFENGRFICSGTVISPTRVLTAAHCARPPSVLTVVAKQTRFGAGGGELLTVTAVAVHPDYATTRLHDLAVLSLGQATTAPTIALPTLIEDPAFTYPGAPLYVAGYGRRNPLAFGRPKVGILMSARVSVRSSCFRYGRNYSDATMICALGRPFPRVVISRAICGGDSGGPLIAYTPAGPRLVGITSYGYAVVRGPRAGINCGFWKSPDVYARVAAALDFIRANLGPA